MGALRQAVHARSTPEPGNARQAPGSARDPCSARSLRLPPEGSARGRSSRATTATTACRGAGGAPRGSRRSSRRASPRGDCGAASGRSAARARRRGALGAGGRCRSRRAGAWPAARGRPRRPRCATRGVEPVLEGVERGGHDHQLPERGVAPHEGPQPRPERLRARAVVRIRRVGGRGVVGEVVHHQAAIRQAGEEEGGHRAHRAVDGGVRAHGAVHGVMRGDEQARAQVRLERDVHRQPGPPRLAPEQQLGEVPGPRAHPGEREEDPPETVGASGHAEILSRPPPRASPSVRQSLPPSGRPAPYPARVGPRSSRLARDRRASPASASAQVSRRRGGCRRPPDPGTSPRASSGARPRPAPRRPARVPRSPP